MTTTERIADRRTAALYIAVVMSCGFITFYSLPDALLFLGRLTSSLRFHGKTIVELRDVTAFGSAEFDERVEVLRVWSISNRGWCDDY